MSNTSPGVEQLVEEFHREHRYRNVLVAFVIIGVLASAVVCVMFSLGGYGIGMSSYHGTSAFGVIAMPLATSMVVGTVVHRSLCFVGRRRARRNPKRQTPTAVSHRRSIRSAG